MKLVMNSELLALCCTAELHHRLGSEHTIWALGSMHANMHAVPTRTSQAQIQGCNLLYITVFYCTCKVFYSHKKHIYILTVHQIVFGNCIGLGGLKTFT